MKLVIKIAVVTGAIVAALAAATTASAADRDVAKPDSVPTSKSLWRTGIYDPIAQDISGYADMQADLEDDGNEWATFLPGETCKECVLGFTYPFVSPTSAVYHRFYLSPPVVLALAGTVPITATTPITPIWTRLQNGTQDPYKAAVAIMSFIHESYHNRLYSGDEGFVNACALRDFGYWLSKDFQIPQTTTTTVMVPQQQTTTKRVPYYARVKHQKRLTSGTVKTWYTRVLRYKTVTTTVSMRVPQQQTNPNPTWTTLVADAQSFYQSQPYPYNAGTCTAAPLVG
jgi:hypothetical protein